MLETIVGAVAGLVARVIEDRIVQPMAIDAQGRTQQLGLHGGTIVQPEPVAFAFTQVEPITVIGAFCPADGWASNYFYGDEPVVVVVVDLDEDIGLEGVVAATTLNDPLVISLYPGSYAFVAIAFIDDDLDEVDGFGYVEFSVAPFEDDFGISIPIAEVDEDEIGPILEALAA